jgi:phosphoesterase RecJ-like protein
MGVSFTKEMALALYTSILIDTSSFRYPTVTGNTHRIIAKLMDCGVEPPFAYNKIYGTKKITYMKLLGEILSTSDMNKEKSIAWISIPESILEKYDVDAEDTHGFVNHLLILDNIKVGCMFRQMGKFVKVSFRSAGEVDVGIIAQALGGGGHDHSAAMIVEATLEECIAETISKMQTMLKNI